MIEWKVVITSSSYPPYIRKLLAINKQSAPLDWMFYYHCSQTLFFTEHYQVQAWWCPEVLHKKDLMKADCDRSLLFYLQFCTKYDQHKNISISESGHSSLSLLFKHFSIVVLPAPHPLLNTQVTPLHISSFLPLLETRESESIWLKLGVLLPLYSLLIISFCFFTNY